jgi:hypothetical protein
MIHTVATANLDNTGFFSSKSSPSRIVELESKKVLSKLVCSLWSSALQKEELNFGSEDVLAMLSKT